LQNHGRVHPLGGGFILLIDFKSDAGATYDVLQELLPRYQDILTRFDHGRTVTNAVTLILSGNRPTARLASQPVRYAAIDGRLTDLNSNPSPHLVPLISDNWQSHFAWRGQGPMPDSDRIKLRDVVSQIHRQGRVARFWAVPDMATSWRELQAAGVDLINTDQLGGLRDFLLQNPAAFQGP
jgi:glycerophosphoryl diester phosphodiesterase